MLIDWFTVAAQVVNFLILVWLLKHFLYDRIVKAIDQREAAIATRFTEAEAREESAAREKRELAQRRLELEEQSGAMLAEAKTQAGQRRQELVDQAKQEVEGQRNNWREALERDRQALAADLARLAGQGAAGMARRVLTDLAGAEADRQSARVFLDKLAALEGEERRELTEALGQAESLEVRAAFDLDQEQRARIGQALAELLGREPDLEFSQDPDLILGLEIRLPGRKLAWSLDEYLREMEEQLLKRLARSLNRGAVIGAEPAPKAEEAPHA
ncbi:MAG: F0F1 ATP synthase subunit delta [Desulfarculaceae bacterium]|nr:F0F1 ATP synthase subunit delta [Desulfarculaceae bacterium]MCF8073162.1 F0F1 ATP synthase subunit delta [Desulfarculaceae bacterium]MCF8100758.1 F0F1 ATP synthase subunit delta [Desulfarculaceae bacterium]MCF8118405.1 F0F1 ATP synthase subunit delta [Desulfarculaceae bacterium]